MVEIGQNYERLTSDSLFQVQSSYLGSDHLLIINGELREKYRNIFYKDIEALLYQPNAQSKMIAAFCGVLGLIVLILAVSSTLEFGFNGVRVFLWGLLCFLVLAFFWLLRGGGSVVFGVQSAVQTVRIVGVNTRSRAQRAVERISARVIEFQGSLLPEDLSAAAAKRKGVKADVVREESLSRGSPSLKSDQLPSAPPPLRSTPRPKDPPETGEDLSRFAPPEDFGN